MKHAVGTLCLALALLMAVPAGPALAGDSFKRPWSELADGVIIQLQGGRAVTEVAEAFAATTIRPVIESERLWLLGFAVTQDLRDMNDLRRLAKEIGRYRFAVDQERAVILAEPYSVSGKLLDGSRMSSWHDGLPEPSFNRLDQDAAQLLQLSQVHQYSSGSDVRVAILDTGLHRQQGLEVVGGYDFVDDDADPTDAANGVDDDGDGQIDEAVGHGTHVAGIVAMTAPGVQILAYRVLGSDGSGSAFAVVAAIDRAIADGAAVINMSFGSTQESEHVRRAVGRAERAGVVVVAAAGNLGTDDKVYPAAYNEVIGTGSVNNQDVASPYSSYGNWVDVYAPAEHIVSVLPDGSLAEWSGTSMAAPFVSGQAALLVSVRQDLTAGKVWEAIRKTSVSVDVDGKSAHRIDIASSIGRLTTTS